MNDLVNAKVKSHLPAHIIAIDLLQRHEGFRSKPYRDTMGKLTIGYGFNLDDTGITKEESKVILANRVNDIMFMLDKKYYWFARLDNNRKAVIVDMVYNLGYAGFANFKRTIQYISANNFVQASIEMLDSRWARQVGNRAKELSKIMKDGR